MSLSGKIALVTGGSRGIGRAISLELAKRGVHVVVNYARNYQDARATANDIRSLGVSCLLLRAHLGEPSKVRQMFQNVEKEFGQLDILVNNAASGVQRPAIELETKHWDWTMDINTRAPWLCAKYAVPIMPNGGRIINITSLGSNLVLSNYTAVGVSKAGLEALTRYLALATSAPAEEVRAREEAVTKAKRRFELARFDQVTNLNTLEARKKFQLVDRLTNATYAQLGFFHQCHELLAELEPTMRELAEALRSSKGTFNQQERLWAARRQT